MNALFTFDLFMVYIPKCKQLWNNTRRYEILHTLNLGCSFINLRDPCNNQRPRCDNAWLRVTNNLCHGWLFSRLTRKIVVEILLVTCRQGYQTGLKIKRVTIRSHI